MSSIFPVIILFALVSCDTVPNKKIIENKNRFHSKAIHNQTIEKKPFKVENDKMVFSKQFSTMNKEIVEYFERIVNSDIEYGFQYLNGPFAQTDSFFVQRNFSKVKEIVYNILINYKKWSFEKYRKVILFIIDLPISEEQKAVITKKIIDNSNELDCAFFSKNEIINADDKLLIELLNKKYYDMDSIHILCILIANKTGYYNNCVKNYIKKNKLEDANHLGQEVTGDSYYNTYNFQKYKMSKSEVARFNGYFKDFADSEEETF